MENRIPEHPGPSSVREVLTQREAKQMGAAAGTQAKRTGRYLESLIIDHPAASLALAASIGVLLGWFMKRK